MCQTRAGVCHVANPRRAWDVTHVSHVSHAWNNKDLACHKACHMVCHACHMGCSCVAPGWIEGGLEGEVGVGEPLAQGLAGRRLMAGGDDHAGLNGLSEVGGGVVAVAAVIAPAWELANMAEELIGFAGLLDAVGGAVFAIGGVEVHGGAGAIGPVGLAGGPVAAESFF